MKVIHDPEKEEKRLWRIAKKRAAFKQQVVAYVLVNAFLIALWYFTSYRIGSAAGFWPFWVIFGWGIGLAFSYWDAYNDQGSMEEREYRKLKRDEERFKSP